MDTSPIPDEHRRLLPRFHQRTPLVERARMTREQAQALRDRMADTDQPIPRGAAGGDARQLRGIPAIGRSVGGAIAGTQPENAVTQRETR